MAAPSSPGPTEQAHEAPLITQFSVFLSNKVGNLLNLLSTFEGHPIRLVALSVIDAADHAVVRIVTSKEGLARQLLARAGLPFSEAPILVVELNIEQGRTLTFLCKALEGLPKVEYLILALYYYELLVLREIGQVLQMSEAAVSLRHTSALARLRKALWWTYRLDELRYRL